MKDPIKAKIQELCPDVMDESKLRIALEALGMMYAQYCGQEGHSFMSAGETASDVLERFGMLSADPAGRGEVKDCELEPNITLAVVLRAIGHNESVTYSVGQQKGGDYFLEITQKIND